MARARADTLLLAALALGIVALVAAMLARGLTTWLEAAAAVTGALCVWLTVRENVWNFPIGMANVAAFLVLFVRARLYADAALQVVYFALGAIGWWLWLYGGAGRTPLAVTAAAPARRLRVALAVALIFAAQYPILRAAGDAAPICDALTTALCLGAQWLTDRKHWESWLLWIVADAVYVPLYASRSLYLTAALYGVFLAMASVGLLRWRESMRASVAPTSRGLPA